MKGMIPAPIGSLSVTPSRVPTSAMLMTTAEASVMLLAFR